jgi:hypothetical protein
MLYVLAASVWKLLTRICNERTPWLSSKLTTGTKSFLSTVKPSGRSDVHSSFKTYRTKGRLYKKVELGMERRKWVSSLAPSPLHHYISPMLLRGHGLIRNVIISVTNITDPLSLKIQVPFAQGRMRKTGPNSVGMQLSTSHFLHHFIIFCISLAGRQGNGGNDHPWQLHSK